MSLLKRKSEDLQELRDIADDVDEAAFCPYACHVDPHTILTKNGELLQTLKIVGFTYEDIAQENENLRDVIRTAITQSILTTDYAIWLHTIRRKASLKPKGDYPADFSKVLNGMWGELKDWEHQYVNEVYLTIVKEGETSDMGNLPRFLRSIVPAMERKSRWKFLETTKDDLNATVGRIHEHLSGFGARRLGFYEQNEVVYSEPLSFLSKLTTLLDQPMPLPDIGLDDYLTAQEVTFGFNAMEVREPDGRRRFGSLLSVKEYRELPTDSIDLLLQVPAEFIITQSMDFINAKKALGEYKKQEQLFKISGEEELPKLTGLAEVLQSDIKTNVDFGEQQLSIFTLGDTVKKMEESVGHVVRALNGIGIIAMREDIKFEEVYWSQLPGNFEFLRRLRSIAAARIGGFANISNYPAGLASGGPWGAPVTVFHTAAQTPYFFNFHIGNNGHTAIIGPEGVGKTVLLNFLLSESQKFHPKVYFFDRDRGAEIFLRSIESEYYFIDRRDAHESKEQERPTFHKVPRMNPLAMESTPQNRSFLLMWLDAMLRADKFYRPEMSEEFWPDFERALDYIYSLPKEERCLTPLIDYLKEQSPKLATKMYGWYKQGEFSRWFDHVEDDLDVSTARKVGFDLTAVVKIKEAMPAIAGYLLHRVVEQLNGEPTIIVLDEAWELMDNPIFASRMGSWLEMLRSRNAIVIMATEKADEVLTSPLSAQIMQQVATQIYMPNAAAQPQEYAKIFGLTPMETQYLGKMSLRRRQFMLKRGRQSIVAELDLRQLKSQVALLSAKEPGLNAMTKIMSEKGLKPKDWLFDFFAEVEKEE
ncbi:MAG: hypothetical protein P8P30_00875 [Rickettsiales bacterium]|nr:hypothetical protein [Rickettsiales bacterium]